MDRLIKRFDGREDDDLFITNREVAYQINMGSHVSYGSDYFNKCLGYEGSDIERCITEARKRLVSRHCKGAVLDVGIGSGAFIKAREGTKGYDINPAALQWLAEQGLYSDSFEDFQAFTFWDVLEHCEDPGKYLSLIPKGGHLFASIPVFDLERIRKSKHYRPNEHLYYFTETGFIRWAEMYGFRLLESNDFESDCGRESIRSFAFQKSLPDYHDTLDQYREMHAGQYYGASSKIYLDYVAPLVRDINPAEILDFGCGRSDLVAHFWNDGERELGRYDPAIPEFKTMPDGKFDLILCCDVMEHIPILGVDSVLSQMRKKSRNRRAIFVISMKKARAHLPDGRNAHVTLLSRKEWMRWISEYFGRAKAIKTKWDHVLFLKTW